MFCRRMSTMKAMRGLSAMRYVKFWSGATPRYTPPGRMVRWSSGMTYMNDVSFETKLSERKNPPGSENSVTMRQNVESLRRVGSSVADAPATPSALTLPLAEFADGRAHADDNSVAS